MIPVTTVTARAATADELTPADYRDIYDELRTKCSLRAFVDLLASEYSIAWWSKYERREIGLTRRAQQELRRAVGLPPLPPTVAEAAAAVDPDAAVYQVGAGLPTRVVLVGRDAPEALTVRLNGHVEAVETPTQIAAVTPVTRALRPAIRSSIVISRPTWQRLNLARLRARQTWDEFLTRLLEESR